MAGITNRGKKVLANIALAGNAGDTPANWKMVLLTSATAPNADTNVLSQLTQIPAGNGYTAGGATVERSAVGMTSVSEDDTNDRSEITIKDVVWTASGGPIPSSGGARYAVLVDDEADPQIIAYFDLGSDRQVSDGQTLTLQAAKIRFNET